MSDIVDQHRRAPAAAILELERAAAPAEAAGVLAGLITQELSPYVYRGSHLAARIRSYLAACAAARAAAPTTDHHQPALFALEPQP